MPDCKKYVIIADRIEIYLAREYYIFAKSLTQYGWELIKLSELNIDVIKRHKSIVLCITFDTFDISQLTCENVTLLYKLDDIYPYKTIRDTCLTACDGIIGTYTYLYPSLSHMYTDIATKPSYWIPHSAVNEFFDDISFNTHPIDTKIFVSGAVSEAYPLRYFITDPKFSHIVDRLRHPSYNMTAYKHNVVNKSYYQRLNDYLCCFCDASAYKFVLLKVFEITSVGSLLLVEDSIQEQLAELGFMDMDTCILCNGTNIFEKISWILDTANRTHVDSIRMKGMLLTQGRHTTDDRVEAFRTIVEGL